MINLQETREERIDAAIAGIRSTAGEAKYKFWKQLRDIANEIVDPLILEDKVDNLTVSQQNKIFHVTVQQLLLKEPVKEREYLNQLVHVVVLDTFHAGEENAFVAPAVKALMENVRNAYLVRAAGQEGNEEAISPNMNGICYKLIKKCDSEYILSDEDKVGLLDFLVNTVPVKELVFSGQRNPFNAFVQALEERDSMALKDMITPQMKNKIEDMLGDYAAMKDDICADSSRYERHVKQGFVITRANLEKLVAK